MELWTLDSGLRSQDCTAAPVAAGVEQSGGRGPAGGHRTGQLVRAGVLGGESWVASARGDGVEGGGGSDEEAGRRSGGQA